MKFPSHDLSLPNGLVLHASRVRIQSWQYHVLKHPLGFNRTTTLSRRSQDDPEDWASTKPPVVEKGWRTQAVQRIAELEVEGQGCTLPEVHGRRTTQVNYACRECPTQVADRCRDVTSSPHPIGPRYAQVAEQLLVPLVDGVLIPVGRLAFAVMSKALLSEIVAPLTVLFVGRAPGGKGQPIARAVRGDGVVVEFNLSGRRGTWRTTYRNPALGACSMANLFLNPPPRLESSLSDSCIVVRHWWEEHGN